MWGWAWSDGQWQSRVEEDGGEVSQGVSHFVYR